MKIFFVCLMIQNTRINPFTLEDNLKRRGFIETVFFLILFKCCKLLQKNFEGHIKINTKALHINLLCFIYLQKNVKFLN